MYSRELKSVESIILFGHVVRQVDHPRCVALLVVIPGDHFYESGVQSDSCIGVENRGQRTGDEVATHNCVFGVTKDSFEMRLGGLLHFVLNLVVGRLLSKSYCQVDN